MSLKNSYTGCQSALLDEIYAFTRCLRPGMDEAAEASIRNIIALHRSTPSSIRQWFPGMLKSCLGVDFIRQSLNDHGPEARDACASLSRQARESVIGLQQQDGGPSPMETVVLACIALLMENDLRQEDLRQLAGGCRSGSHGISDVYRDELIRLALRRPEHDLLEPLIDWLRLPGNGGLAAVILTVSTTEIDAIAVGLPSPYSENRVVDVPVAFRSPDTATRALASSALRLMLMASDRTSGPDFLSGKRMEVAARIRNLARIMVHADDETFCMAMRHLLPAITLPHGRLIKLALPSKASIPLVDRLAQLMVSGLLKPNEVASRHPVLESTRMAIRLGSGALSATAAPQRDRQRTRARI